MKSTIDRETAEQLTYDLVAHVQNQHVQSCLIEFPGYEALGLAPNNAGDYRTAQAIVRLCEAARSWAEHSDNSAGFGGCATMIEFGLVAPDNIRAVLSRAYRIGHAYADGAN